MAGFLSAGMIGSSRAAVLYNVYDLGTVSGGSNTIAISINNSGQIVGFCAVGGNKANTPVFWTNALTAPVELSQSGSTFRADDINNAGEIVGGDTSNGGMATYWTNAASDPVYLALQGDTPQGEAEGINSGSQIVGRYKPLGSVDSPAFWTNRFSLLLPMDHLGGSSDGGAAHAINDSGRIVGETGPTKNQHATFWTNYNSVAVDLGTLGGTNSLALSINAAGQIVGSAYDSNQLWHAAFWTNGASPAIELPSLGNGTNGATCINNSGQIVGLSGIVPSASNPLGVVAVLWTNLTSTPVDLNALIAPNSGWVLLAATGINDSGEIIGFGAITNLGVPQEHAFALIPTAPTSGADLALGGTNTAVATYTEGIVYSLYVTNLGPDTATGVVVSNQIPADMQFISSSDGSTPTNGVLLLYLGSLASGVVTNVTINILPTNYVVGPFTNVFQVFANETDPVPANNSAAFITDLVLPTTEFSASTAEVDTTNAMTVSLQVTNYSTELIARLPNGTVVYDQTFSAPLSDPTVQSAITTAAADLSGAGAPAYSGPMQTSFSQTTNNSSVTVPGGTNINLIVGTKQWVGPVTIKLGNFGIVQGYTFDAVVTNYALPIGGHPSFLTLPPGATDFDTMILALFDFLPVTTNTSTFTNSAVYVMAGITPLYTVKDLGTLTGTNSQAMAINNPGQIVGEATLLGGAYHAAFWTNVLSPPVNLGDPSVSLASDAYSINNSSNIAGLISGAAFTRHAAFWTNSLGPPVDLGTLAGGSLSVAYSVNDSGQIAGYSSINSSGSEELGCFWTNSASPGIGLGTLGGNNSAAMSINASGRMVGSADTASANHAAFWTNSSSSPVDLGTLGVGSDSEANSINNAGQIVGDSDVVAAKSITHAAFWTNFTSPPFDLGILPNGTISTATCINNLSQIVGDGNITNNPAMPLVATLWPAPGNPPEDLNCLIPTNSGWYLLQANGINDLGEIVGTGVVSNSVEGNQLHAFALIPANLNTNSDLGLSASAAPEPVGVSSNLVYTLTITNHGPNTANSVTISNQIPAGINFVSATGGNTPSGGILLIGLGSLAANGTATAQVIVQPESVGKLTNLFTVFANETDPVLANNSATVISTVTNVPVVLQADVKLTALAAPEPVGVSNNLVYTLTITNRGPNAASGVVVSNRVPANVTFVSATGGNTPLGGILLIGLGSLAANGTTNAQVTIQPDSVGKLTNLFTVFANEADPVPTNNPATVISTVTNVPPPPPPPVDLALSIVAEPNPVNTGAPLTYSLTLTNQSSTTATSIVVSNTLPAGVTLDSALPSQGTVTTNGSILRFAAGSLANGVVATFAIVVTPNAAGSLTNSAIAGSAETDSQYTNNVTRIITSAVPGPGVTNLVLTVLSGITLNPQTGLYEVHIQVYNGGPDTPSSVIVLVHGLAANATLYNASGTTNGVPYVQSALPLPVSSNVVFVLEIYVPTRVKPTNLTYTVMAGPPVILPIPIGTPFSVDSVRALGDGSMLVEFTAVPGHTYAIQYSSDMNTWRTAVPAITAPANRVQWIDAGPPKTDSPPQSQPARYYRVVLIN